MKDRQPTRPGRVKITPESGEAYYAVLEMADEPTEVGTPPTKANLLKDTTAALLGGGADMVPDDALVALKVLIDAVSSNANKRAEIETISYTGTGTYGASNPTKINFSQKPKTFIIVSDSTIAIATSSTNKFVVITMSGTTNQTVTVQNPTFAWSGNQAQIYSEHSSYGSKYQCNVSGRAYDVVAFY